MNQIRGFLQERGLLSEKGHLTGCRLQVIFTEGPSSFRKAATFDSRVEAFRSLHNRLSAVNPWPQRSQGYSPWQP